MWIALLFGMQSGIDSSRLQIGRELSGAMTRIDIRPQGANNGATTIFGADGLTFRDALDAINPLNHIPIVSDILADATGHVVSTASKLVGGALIGGPIGFIASLASVIFEGETGHSPAQAAYAALTEESSTLVVHNTALPEANEEVTALAAPVNSVEETQIASLEPAVVALANSNLSVATERARSAAIPRTDKDRAVLELFGNSSSALGSYKKAQLLPYLRDANHSQVL
ncbi:MAG: hypothetical protein ACOYNL_07545 [Rickettsiales bacterium]